ncbi:MAG: hypothetical protein WDN26_12280 [Chitinophagaceae bacterium]
MNILSHSAIGKFTVASVLLLGTSFIFYNSGHVSNRIQSNTVDIGCSPGASLISGPGKDGKFIGAMPGWFFSSYKVSAKNDSAQFYFDQGLAMYYSYHMAEAIASFKEAARVDSTLAIAWWGQALAMGPAYNNSYAYIMKKEVPAVVARMKLLISNAPPKEKDLIEAIISRYDISDSADTKRKDLNKNYSGKMKMLIDRYPGDDNIKALYIDAVMLEHEWDFWNNDGTPKEWTPELVELCKKILKNNSTHPAALHYYIHVTEASRTPEVALSSADLLKDIMPGVAHMVHMSSHEYERIGMYTKGSAVNEKADSNLAVYHNLAPQLNSAAHSPHYFAVDAYCALSGGMYKKAMAKAQLCRNIVSPDHTKTHAQYLYMLPALVQTRLGKWKEIIADTLVIDKSWTYAGLLNDFAKGMAFANTENLTEARRYLEALREKAKDEILKQPFVPYMSSPKEVALIAEKILEATIYFFNKEQKLAAQSLQVAIAAEDKLIYVEPKVWILPARQYAGTYLLKSHQYNDAEKIFRNDLIANPGNGWSLIGLFQSLEAQNGSKEAETIKPLYLRSFSDAEEIPPSAVWIYR